MRYYTTGMKSIFKRSIKNEAVCFAMVLAFLRAGEMFAAVVDKSFGDYNVILERKPFGEYIEPVPDAGQTNEQPESEAVVEFRKYITMCAITDSARGVRVGLRSTKENPPKTYFLYVGDVDGSVELLDADYRQGMAFFSVDGQEMELTLESTAAPPPEQEKPGVAPPVPQPQGGISRPQPPQIPDPSAKNPSPAPKINLPENVQNRLSYAERRKMKLDEEAQREQKEKMLEEMARKYKESKGKVDATSEDRQKRLQNEMMDLIREGKTSEHLPIVLTPEMEEQLIKEGVLPSRQ